MKKLVLTLILFLFLPLPQAESVPTQTRHILAQANRKAEADQLFEQGRQQAITSQFRAAIQSWEKALIIYREIGDRPGEGASLGNLGVAYYSLGQYEKVIKFHQQSLAISREIGDIQGEAKSLSSLGNAYYFLGQYEKAINFHQQSLAISREMGDIQEEGASLGNLGVAYQSIGQYEKAIKFYQQSLDIDREIGDIQGEAKSLGNLGNAYYFLGQYEKAIKFHQQSLAILREIGDRQGEVPSLSSLGNAYQSIGQYRKAIEFHQQSLNIARKIGNRRWEAKSLGNLGNAYYSLGQYEKAIKFHQQSLAISREIGDIQGESVSLSNLGVAYDSLGQYRKAIKFHQQSLAISREIGDRQGEGSFLGNLGLAYYSLGQYRKAIKFHQQSLAISREIGDRQGETVSLSNLGLAYYSLGQYRKAIKFHQQSLAISREIGDRRGKGNSLGNLGLAYYSLGQYRKAIKFHQKHQDIASEIGNRQGEVLALNNLGYALHKASKIAEAEKVLKKGIKIHEKLREGLNTANKLSIFEEQTRTYRLLKEALITQKKMEIALEVAEQSRTRTLVELLAKDLDNPPQPPSLSEIKEIAKKQKATLVEYAVTYNDVHIEGKLVSKESELYIWVIQPSGEVEFQSVDLTHLWKAKEFGTTPLLSSLQFFWEQKKPAWGFPLTITTSLLSLLSLLALIYFYRKTSRTKILLPWLLGFICLTSTSSLIFLLTSNQQFTTKDKTSQSAFAQLITTISESIGINSRGLGELAQPGAQQYTEENLKKLHQLLIDPIAHLLPQDPQARVVFIPDQELFFVPFAALQDEQGKYLIDKHTIISSPSIQVLDLTQQRKTRLTGTTGESLIVGNPEMPLISMVRGEEPDHQLEALPGAEIEAKAIAQMQGVQPLIGEEATETTVVEKMPQAKLIHLATHGSLDGYQGNIPGFIAFAKDEKNDGLLNAVDIYNMKLQADLVVLSACNTGLGEITSDGIIGLSRAFFNAGVPSLVVSLWSLPDNPTAPLMTEFYKNLQTNPDKAQALRQAMLTRKEVDPDPVNWAGFMLLGQAE